MFARWLDVQTHASAEKSGLEVQIWKPLVFRKVVFETLRVKDTAQGSWLWMWAPWWRLGRGRDTCEGDLAVGDKGRRKKCRARRPREEPDLLTLQRSVKENAYSRHVVYASSLTLMWTCREKDSHMRRRNRRSQIVTLSNIRGLHSQFPPLRKKWNGNITSQDYHEKKWD